LHKYFGPQGETTTEADADAEQQSGEMEGPVAASNFAIIEIALSESACTNYT